LRDESAQKIDNLIREIAGTDSGFEVSDFFRQESVTGTGEVWLTYVLRWQS